MKQELTAQELRNILSYDSATGLFTWLVSRGRAVAGDQAGSPNSRGYIHIKIFKVLYKAHRLAWLYMYGTWPLHDIDHINRIKTDNRICNLRLATRSMNTQNTPNRSSNTSGQKGVCWLKRNKKWVAKITVNYSIRYLGVFNDFNEAVAARKKAEKQFHPYAI